MEHLSWCGAACDCPSDYCAASAGEALAPASAQPVTPRRSWRLPSLRLAAAALWAVVARRLFGWRS